MGKLLQINRQGELAWNEITAHFLDYKKAEGLSVRTLNDYEKLLSLIARRQPRIKEAAREAVIAFLGSFQNPNSYNVYFAYLKTFFDWCIREGYHKERHPLDGLKKRRPIGRVVHIENTALTLLLSLPDRSTFVGLRDYALLLFSLDCGARPGESLQLAEKDFNFPGLLVTIPGSVAKTRQPRTIPITNQTMLAIRTLLEAHHPDWKRQTIFCTQDGSRYASRSWQQRLKAYSVKLGTTLTPYHLRHAAALGMLRGGMSAFALRDMLGHTNISTTQKYLALTLDDLRREHEESNLIDSIAPKRARVRKV